MNIEGVSVRFATLADLEFVQQDQYLPADIVRRKVEWQEVVVAEWDGRSVGYARLEYLWSHIPYLALIRVLPAYQHQGVGQAMLHYLEAHICAQGHTALYSSSQADEPKPQAWHWRVGFEECGIIAGINKGGVDEIFFRKRLP